MKGMTLGLAGIVLTLFLPPAHALNCTIYYGDYRSLCTVVNPLPIDESYKFSLMQPNLYGSIDASQESINLNLNEQNEAPITLESIYEDKIIVIGKFFAFILANYGIFSILTKSSIVRRWLTAVS